MTGAIFNSHTRLRDLADTPELCMIPPKSEGAGNAGCPLHPQPRVQGRKHTSVVATGSAGFTRRFLHDGFNGLYRALPGDRAFLPPSPADIGVSGPIGPTSPSANLTPASGRQDHTTSPSARSALVSRAACVHRIQPRVRDDRDTPLASPKPARMSERAAVAKPPVAGTEPVTPQRR